jgi:uncharacterized protein (DUF885 family)
MTDPAATTDLDRLAADAWEAWLEHDPLFATSVGDTRFDTRLPDIAEADEAASRARFVSLLGRLDDLPADDGSSGAPEPADAVTRSALRQMLGDVISLIDTGLAAWNVDPLEGIPAYVLGVPDFQRHATPGERAAMLERLGGIGGYVDAHIDRLRTSLAGGLVACSSPVDSVVDILAGLLATPDEAWAFVTPATAPSPEGDPADTDDDARFAARLRDAVATVIRPAFARLHHVLSTEILPAARPPERPGLCHVPGGGDVYRRLIRVHTSLDLAPDELHRTGLAEIARIDAEMEALAARTIGSRSRTEAIARLRGDPALHFATREEVHAKAVEALDRAEAAIPAWFGRLPRAACDVVDMAAHEEEHNTIAYYRHPAEDGSRPGQYYLNTSHPETRPRYEAEVLAYHESIPGHHLQIAIAQELEGLPAFRRHLGPTAFFEGWGLYTERLADEMGLYAGDLDRIGVLSFDAWRASRLVVDTGMHAMGWTRQQAIDYMLDHTALAPNNITNEVDRYISMPGQALAYKTGQDELLRLRAEARDRLGRAFDIRSFHDAVLENGAIGLATLREIVGAWIDRHDAVR